MANITSISCLLYGNIGKWKSTTHSTRALASGTQIYSRSAKSYGKRAKKQQQQQRLYIEREKKRESEARRKKINETNERSHIRVVNELMGRTAFLFLIQR